MQYFYQGIFLFYTVLGFFNKKTWNYKSFLVDEPLPFIIFFDSSLLRLFIGFRGSYISNQSSFLVLASRATVGLLSSHFKVWHNLIVKITQHTLNILEILHHDGKKMCLYHVGSPMMSSLDFSEVFSAIGFSRVSLSLF